MGRMSARCREVDLYIAGFPEEVRRILRKIRTTIREAAPEAHETFSYRMPGYALRGSLIHFAAYRTHIGLYPALSGSEAFNRQLARYRASKSTLRFPLDEPIPYALITRIVKLRLRETAGQATTRGRPASRPPRA